MSHLHSKARRLALGVVAAVLLACGSGDSQPSFEITDADSGWNLFRHRNPDFRFLFPAAWTVKQPKGSHVRALVSSNDLTSGASCNVGVNRSPVAALLAASGTIPEMAGTDLISKEKFPDARIVEERKIGVDNVPAKLVVFDASYATIHGAFQFRQLIVFTARDSELFTITCGALASGFEPMRPIFLRLVSSFVFESWEQ